VVSADAEYGAQGILSVVTTEAPGRTIETLLHRQVAGPVTGGATMKAVRVNTATARPPPNILATWSCPTGVFKKPQLFIYYRGLLLKSYALPVRIR
jgi:hypothetical protein